MRWSLSRVGVSVMNSRKAQKPATPESTTVAVGPRKNEAASTEQSTHQAWTLMRKVSKHRSVQAAVVAGAEGADEDRRPRQQDEHAAHESQSRPFCHRRASKSP